MAATAITPVKLTLNADDAMPTMAAVAAGDGALVPFDSQDAKTVILLESTESNSSITALIKAGDGIQGVNDLSITLAAGAKKAVVIDSGAYKIVSGANKGKVLVKHSNTTATSLKVGAIVLP